MQVNGIFSLASQQANWLSVRQQTVAENISNANTPGFRAKDTEPFSALLHQKFSTLVRTDPSHIAPSGTTSGIKLLEASSVGGNSGVNIETELMKSTEIRSQFELNAAIIRSFHRMILNAAKA